MTIGLSFEPLCMVVVIAPASRKALFGDLLAAGRPLVEPLRVQVNFTVGLEANPSVDAITANCQNSMHMHENHQRDTILQHTFAELDTVRDEMRQNRKYAEMLQWANAHTLFFQPPSSPPPPPPPPPPPVSSHLSSTGPPAPPVQLSVADRTALFEHEYAILKAREERLLQEASGCVGFGATARDRVCGISAVEAPNPWVGKAGERCRGFATLSARYGDFCGCVPNPEPAA